MTQIDKQTLRDIFNSNGLNYSQIVGDELTTVSMELQDFNYSLEQVLALIANQVREARIDELERLELRLCKSTQYGIPVVDLQSAIDDRIKELGE